MGGLGGSLSKHPLSSASLLLLPCFILPETRTDNVASMHECYLFLLVMFSMANKCFFVHSVNEAPIERGKLRAGPCGGRGREEGGTPRNRGLSPQNVSNLRETYS